MNSKIIRTLLFAATIAMPAAWYMDASAAAAAETVPYTSMWGDYKTSVPDGWKVSQDFEEKHFADTFFRNGKAPSYGMAIRWYNRYATHRLSDGSLEMYTGVDDYIKQTKGIFEGTFAPEEEKSPASEVEIGGEKAKRFVVQWKESHGEHTAAMVGVLVGKEIVSKPGEHGYTVVKTSSGFYVLVYFAPKGGYGKYEKEYDQMVASFELIKDGPGGVSLPGKTAMEERPDEVLRQLVSEFQAQRDVLFGSPVTVKRDSPAGLGYEPISVEVSGWFADVPLRMERKIIEFTSTMKSPPAIPDEATRDFVKAGTYMKDAKEVSDYKSAIDAFEKALYNAPWWGDAYYNLGVAFEAAGRYDDAMESMKLYLLTNPATAAEDKKRIYAIEAKQEKAAKIESEMRAKYGAKNHQEGGFNFDSLYRYGAIVQDMSFDASGSARTISLKIQTRKENGRLVNYLAIFDITSTEDTFGRKFNVDWRGEQTFYLDDRSSPGKESMTLTVTPFGDGDAKISIRPSDNASASIQITLAELFRERARQIVYCGEKMKIGEKMFYLLGQGGEKGSLLFFPAEIKDQLEHADVRGLSPMFVAIINKRDSGENKRFTNSDLGVLNGTHYHLEYEGDSWVPKIGQGQDH
jgi:tetratricopeptide (TPR) repeat protein